MDKNIPNKIFLLTESVKFSSPNSEGGKNQNNMLRSIQVSKKY